MKNIIHNLATIIGVILIMACEKEQKYDEVSQITNYPTFTLAGDNPMVVELGTSFTEPGVTATEAGVNLPVTSSVMGRFSGNTSVDPNTIDHYIITYRAENTDGFPGSTTRDVLVVEEGDLVNSISGAYVADVVRDEVAEPAYMDMGYVLIWENPDGTYTMSHGIGGYYDIGRAYGTAYSSPVTFTANDIPANDFTIPSFPVGTFGGNVTITDMQVDPVAETITFTATWDMGFTFDVTLTQV